MLKQAYDSRELLEEQIAEGRRNRKEAGNKYGQYIPFCEIFATNICDRFLRLYNRDGTRHPHNAVAVLAPHLYCLLVGPFGVDGQLGVDEQRICGPVLELGDFEAGNMECDGLEEHLRRQGAVNETFCNNMRIDTRESFGSRTRVAFDL